MRTVEVKAPRGPLKLDAYDNPIQNVYVRASRRSSTRCSAVLTNVPIKTYEAVSQFWTWKPEEFLERGRTSGSSTVSTAGGGLRGSRRPLARPP